MRNTIIRASMWILQKLSFRLNGVRVWGVCNIYPTAKLGKNVKIGWFTEIGNNVVIGDNVTIGAMCFIPEGVTIETGAWIGPRCTFTNDRYPPKPKEHWEKTIVRKGASLGAGVTVVCGVEIGDGALIGAGAVITKNIPAWKVYAGVPAQDIYEKTNGGS